MLDSLKIKQFKISDVRESGKSSVRHLVELLPEHAEGVSVGSISKRVKRLKIQRGRNIWVESEGCDVCNTILSHGSFLVSGRSIKDYKLVYSFIAPNFDAYMGVVSALREKGFKFRVLKVGRFRLKGEVLTERQERVLWLALKMGFLSTPKG